MALNAPPLDTSIPLRDPGELPPDPLEKIRALLAQYKPQQVTTDLPPPALPQGPDLGIMRDALTRANTLGMVHGIFGVRTPSTYEVMRTGSAQPQMMPSPSYDAARAQIMQPAQLEQARAGIAGQQVPILNEYNKEKAQMGLKAQEINQRPELAEIKGLLGGLAAMQNNQAKRDVANIGAGAKPKVTALPPGAVPVSNQTGKPLGPPNDGGAGSIDDGIIEREADRYNATGAVQTPKGLRGVPAQQFVTKVMNRAEEKARGATAPPKPLAAAASGYASDSASQKKLQALSDTTDAFESTAIANLGQFLDVAKKVTDTGSPLLNRPVRWLEENLGDPNVAAFKTARQVAVTEIAKVLSSSNAQITDSARHEVAGLIGPNASGAQIAEAAKILRADMENRRASNKAQLQTIGNRISGQVPIPTGPVTIRRKKDGMTKTLPADRAAQYLQDPGFEQVNE